MIATGLTFLFGALLTALVALIVAPLVWRKAQSLARRDYEATIPTSANEIRAEFDKVRADAAVSVRRGEVVAAQAREKSAKTQAELGRATVENVELLKRNRRLDKALEERDETMAQMRATLSAREEDHGRLTRQLAAAVEDGDRRTEELEALGLRFQDLTDIAEERKIQIVAAETKIDRLGDGLRSSERATREAKSIIERLRGEAGSLERSAGQERTQIASLNDRISTLLAGVADRDEEISRLKEQLTAAIVAEAAAEEADRRASESLRERSPAPGTAQQRLRATLARRGGTLTTEDAAAVREQISDLAARVIGLSAGTGDEGSPAARIMAAAPPAGHRQGGLADRVRRLMETEKKPPAERPKTAKA